MGKNGERVWRGQTFKLILIGWSKNNILESKHGEEVTLVSDIEALTRCYFVFTDNGGSGLCCFNEHGSDEDCETSEDYKQRNYRNCPDYDLTIVNGIDSTDTETFT